MALRPTTKRHRPEQTTLYRLVQQHAVTFIAQAEDAAGAELPQFVKDEFDAFLECGILAHGFLRLRCGDCGHDKLVAPGRQSRAGSKVESTMPCGGRASTRGLTQLRRPLL
jgi:ribosomal protein S27E